MNRSLTMIKGIKRRNSQTGVNEDGFDPFVPFGTDGTYVDMDSQLNLEEQLLIGGNSEISIIENSSNDSITIIEKYKHREKNGETISFVYDYSTVTEINGAVERLLAVDDNTANKRQIKVQESNDSPLLIATYDTDGDSAQIKISLYKGQYTGAEGQFPIHQKLITIELNDVIDSTIDEQLIPQEGDGTDSEGGNNNG